MKPLIAWLGVAAAGLVAGVATGQLWFLFAGLLVAVIGLGLHSARRLKHQYAADADAGLSPEARAELAGMRKSLRQIEAWVAQNPNDPVVKVIGAEAKQEGAQLYELAVEALRRRRRIREALAAKSGVVAARAQAEAAGDPEAVLLQDRALADFAPMESQLEQIEADLRQAEAGLAALYASLSSQSLRAQGESAEDEVRDRLSQLQSLAVSFEEARRVMPEIER